MYILLVHKCLLLNFFRISTSVEYETQSYKGINIQFKFRKDSMGLGVFALSLYQLLLPSLNIWHFVFHQDRFDTQQFIYTIAMY